MRRLFFFALLLLPAACLAQVDDSDGASRTGGAASPSSDAGAKPPEASSSTAEDEPGQEQPGLWVDDEACTTITPLAAGRDWPEWGMTISANCGALGPVRLLVSSRADIPYPQACSVVTYVAAGFDAEGDAGTLYWEANASSGDCSVKQGPQTSDPATAIAFEATLQYAPDPSRARKVVYRAAQ